MKILRYPALRLLLFPALVSSGIFPSIAAGEDGAPVEKVELNDVARIEQHVLAREFESSTNSLGDLAVLLSQAETPEEKNRLQVSIAKYIVWLNEIDQQLRKTGSVEDDVSDQLNACSYRLNDVAWHMLLQPEFSTLPHDLAKTLAALAVRQNPARPALHDTYARALAGSGAMDQAIAEQLKAVELSKEASLDSDALEEILASYRKGVIPAAEAPTEWLASESSEPSEALQREEELREKRAEAAEASREKANRLNEIAWSMATSSRQIPQRAVALADIALTYCPERGSFRSRILDTKARGLFGSQQRDEAIKTQEEAIKGCDEGDDLKEELEANLQSFRDGKSPGDQGSGEADYDSDGAYLNELAWSMVTRKDPDAGQVETARTLVETALHWDEENKGRRPAYLDTLARAEFLASHDPQGNSDTCLRIQKEAVAAAESLGEDMNEELIATLKDHLASYERHELPEEPEADEP